MNRDREEKLNKFLSGLKGASPQTQAEINKCRKLLNNSNIQIPQDTQAEAKFIYKLFTFASELINDANMRSLSNYNENKIEQHPSGPTSQH